MRTHGRRCLGTRCSISLAVLLVGIVPSNARSAEVVLGGIDFPTSVEGGAQDAFIRGVLYLHSFEYAPAAAAFRHAQSIDPDFAMAYWGEAMTNHHSL